jgi:hypothetical protein
MEDSNIPIKMENGRFMTELKDGQENNLKSEKEKSTIVDGILKSAN